MGDRQAAIVQAALQKIAAKALLVEMTPEERLSGAVTPLKGESLYFEPEPKKMKGMFEQEPFTEAKHASKTFTPCESSQSYGGYLQANRQATRQERNAALVRFLDATR